MRAACRPRRDCSTCFVAIACRHLVDDCAEASSARCAHSAVMIAGALGSGVEKTSWLKRSMYAVNALS